MGVVGLLFGGNVPLAAFVSRGARAFGEGTYSFDEPDLERLDAPHAERMHSGGSSLQLLRSVTTPSGERKPMLAVLSESIASEHRSAVGGLCVGLSDACGSEDHHGFELTPLENSMVVQAQGAVLLPRRHGTSHLWERGSIRLYGFDPESCRDDLVRRCGDAAPPPKLLLLHTSPVVPTFC